MSILACLSCHAEVTNGLALCELCQRRAVDALLSLPVFFRNLARWRPGRAGSRQVPGSRVLYDGDSRREDSTGDRISDSLDEAHNALMTWARLLVQDRPLPRPLTMADAVLSGDLPAELADALNDNRALAVTSLCEGLRAHLTSAATREWAGQFVRDLAHHDRRLHKLTTESAFGWYAGHCRQCEAEVYVIPGLRWVTCSAVTKWGKDREGREVPVEWCGATTFARDHIDAVLKEASAWTATPKRLAEAIVALVDDEMSVLKLRKRISKWGDRGRIEAVQHVRRDYEYDDGAARLVVTDQPFGLKRYRLGDVLDLLARDGTTRLEDDQSQIAIPVR